MKRPFGQRPALNLQPDWEPLPKPEHLQAKVDELRQWLTEKMYGPHGLECPGISLIDIWHYGSYVGIDDKMQDEFLEWHMNDLGRGIEIHRNRQRALARSIKYTSSGHAQWWERARKALEATPDVTISSCREDLR